jgi:hypothetical protein
MKLVIGLIAGFGVAFLNFNVNALQLESRHRAEKMVMAMADGERMLQHNCKYHPELVILKSECK